MCNVCGIGNRKSNQQRVLAVLVAAALSGSILAIPTAATGQAPAPPSSKSSAGSDQDGAKISAKRQRAEVYRQFLVEEGYAPQIDKDGDVMFKHEGGTYCIMIDEKDDMFFRLVYPMFWEIESVEERAKVIQAANFATAETKVAKVFPVGDNTCASVEMFCSPPEAFKPVFRRCLSVLQTSVQTFKSQMGK